MHDRQSTTRRRFLTAAASAATLSLLRLKLFASAPSKLASDPRRPQFHLLPAATG
jgi:hypothetical protein